MPASSTRMRLTEHDMLKAWATHRRVKKRVLKRRDPIGPPAPPPPWARSVRLIKGPDTGEALVSAARAARAESGTHVPRFQDLVREACEAWGLPRAEVLGERRTKPLVGARAEIAWRASKLLGWSLPRIGRGLGGRDHTTILHAIRNAEAAIAARFRLSGPASADVPFKVLREALFDAYAVLDQAEQRDRAKATKRRWHMAQPELRARSEAFAAARAAKAVRNAEMVAAFVAGGAVDEIAAARCLSSKRVREILVAAGVWRFGSTWSRVPGGAP